MNTGLSVSDRKHPQVVPSVALDCSSQCGVWDVDVEKIFVSET